MVLDEAEEGENLVDHRRLGRRSDLGVASRVALDRLLGHRGGHRRGGPINRRRARDAGQAGPGRRGGGHRHRARRLLAADRDLGPLAGRGHRGPVPALGIARHPAAEWAPHRDAGDEHPADVRHRLAPDQPAVVEQPRILGVELLIGVVGEDRRVHLVSDREDESIASSHGPRRRRDELVVLDRGVELGNLRRVDAVPEGGVDDDGHQVVRVLLDERLHGVDELFEAGHRTAFGGDVRSVDDDVSRHNACQSSSCGGTHDGHPRFGGGARRRPTVPILGP